MSKERELLHAWLCINPNPHIVDPMYEKIYKSTKELLAQPEQEPEAWMLIDKETGARIPRADKPKHERNKDRWEQYPLYTSPPKREPLSDADVIKETIMGGGGERWE